MKRKLGILLVSALLALSFSCAAHPPGQAAFSGWDSGFVRVASAETLSIFSAIPSEFSFLSGAGGWSTDLLINPDGTFTGYFHDAEMGDMGSDYPKGTRYECYFNGKFTDAFQISENEYSMRLEYLYLNQPAGQITIVDGVRVITSDPFGMDNAGEFRLYLPGRASADLPESFLEWMRAPGAWNDTPTLQVYGLYNMGGEQGFYAAAEPPASSVLGYVNTNKTNLRPSTTTSGKAIGCLMRGDPVEILEACSGGGENWYRIRTDKVIIGDDYVFGAFEGYIVTRLVDVPDVPAASSPAQPGLAQCPDCGGWFEEGNVFRNHLCVPAESSPAQPKLAQCPDCGGWFEEGNVFRNHICVPAVP